MEHAEPAARVTAYPDGPLVVRGDFVVCDVEGNALVHDRIVALCRCGRSAAKPLCDGSHKRSARRHETDRRASSRCDDEAAAG